MLTRRLLPLLGLLLAIVGAQPAAAGPVECPSSWVWNAGYQACVLTATGGGGDPGNPGGGGGGGGGGERICVYGGEVIPCETADGYWIGPPYECYIKLTEPQPPKSDPVWKGKKDGAIYHCSKRFLAGTNDFDYDRWWASAPPAAGADPSVLIAQAITQMGLRGIEMGSTPPMQHGKIGIIGFPTWLWAIAPSPQTWGPASATVSAGGVTVTARAAAKRVTWEMGDGTVVECDGPGTEWTHLDEAVDSPTCGHRYTDDGYYDVQAVTFWDLRWSGMGLSGTIPLALFSRGEIAMGEAQVIRTG
jgi:hypothetical protein